MAESVYNVIELVGTSTLGERRRGSHRAAEVSQALRREPTAPRLEVSFKYESKD